MKYLVLFLSLVLASPALSGDFDKGKAAYLEGDYTTALEEITPLSNDGNAAAQNLLGIMYEKGQGVPQDNALAVKWYKLAAAQGELFAQRNLGVMYYKGTGMAEDVLRAQMWFTIASQAGYEKAQRDFNNLSPDLSPAQREQVQSLVKACVELQYKGC